MSNNKSSGGFSVLGTLFIVFLVLKLTGNIDWSWWWVTSPLWIPIALFFSIVIVISFIILVAVSFGIDVSHIRSKIDKFKK
jgi:uncharacterized protein (DUF983 family)